MDHNNVANGNNNFNLVRLLNQMFTNNANSSSHLPRLHLPVDEQLRLPPQLYSMTFTGYKDDISAVVSKTFDNSPRTADSVRTILTPRYPVQHDFPTSSYYTNSSTLGSDPITTLSSNPSTWQWTASSAPEVTFSDMSLTFPRTPRSSKSVRSYTVTPRTPKSERYGIELERIPERNGSDFTREELRTLKLNERALPTPRTPLPGRKENGVHIPYLDLPGTSRSNTLVNFNDLLTTLLSSYKSSTGALTNAKGGGGGSLNEDGPYFGNSGRQDAGYWSQTGDDKRSSKREKMILAGLVGLALVVLLLIVIVVLLALDVGGDDDSKSSSSQRLNPSATGNIIDSISNGSTPNGSFVSNTTLPAYVKNGTLVSSTTAVTASTTSFPSVIILPDGTTSTTRIIATSTPTPSTSQTEKNPIIINGNTPSASQTAATTTADGGEGTTRRTLSTLAAVIVNEATTSSPSTPRKSTIVKDVIPNLPVTTSAIPTFQTETTSTTAKTTTTTNDDVVVIPNEPTTTLKTTATIQSSSRMTTTSAKTTTPTPTTTETTETTAGTTTTTTTTTTTPATTENPLVELVQAKCLTNKCQEFSELIESAQNVSANPCFEYHEYSCGKDDPSLTDGVTPLHQLVIQDLYTVAADVLSSEALDSSAGILFRKCMDSNTDDDDIGAYSEVNTLLKDISLSQITASPTLSLDLLLRRLQDKFDLHPFFKFQRVPEFDGFAYNYITRVSPPSLIFPEKEHHIPLEDSTKTNGFIDTVTNIIDFNIIGGGLIRNKRSMDDDSNDEDERQRVGYDDVIQLSRKKRQAPVTKDDIRAKVKEVLRLEWAIAEILPTINTPPEFMLVQNLPVRVLLGQVPSIPWTLLTDLTVIDNIQVQYLQYFIDFNNLIEAFDTDVVKLYAYVRAVVGMLPFMPAAIRGDLDDNNINGGISQTYSTADCAKMTFQLLPDDIINTISDSKRLTTEEQWAVIMAENAKSDIQRVIGSFQGISQNIKLAVLNDIASIGIVFAYSSSNQGIATAYFPYIVINLVKPDGGTGDNSGTSWTSSFLIVANEILEERNAISKDTLQRSVNRKAIFYTDFEPTINSKDNTLELPIALVHLSAWVKDADFMMPFYKSFTYRTLMDYVMRKHIYTNAFSRLQSCWRRQFPFLSSYEDTRGEIAVLVEAATMELLYENLIVRTNYAVQMGQSYFYERQLVYQAYAQPLCLSNGFSDNMSVWKGSIRTDALLDSIFTRHYKGVRSFQCSQPSCFFWSQSITPEEQ